jgi:RHS repeat-associated protein
MTPGIVAESDLSGNLKSEYVFFNGERLARKDFPGDTVSYYFSDHLKTASVITDSAGNITEDDDYYPWGGELQFVNGDSNHYKFTGKERDAETGLDYFGARFYSNPLGRFLSADWSEKPETVPYAEIDDPQSLNLYGYVRNLPTSKIDIDGHKECGFYCHFKNWWTDGGWNNDEDAKVERERRLHARAEHARKLLSQMRNFTIHGKSPADFAKGATDQDVINGLQAATNFVFSEVSRPCGSEASCGIVFPLGLPEGAFSDYINITRPGSIQNIQTNVTAADFGANLEADGFTKSSSGNVTIYTKGTTQYAIYPVSNSTQGPTAQFSIGGKTVAKIRLQ